jgi:16S rRNA C967 or C1407 C5-methylase (RsmB/RsmF family)
MLHALALKYADLVEDPRALDASLSTPLPQTFWVHDAKGAQSDVLRSLANQGVSCRELSWRPGAWRVQGPERVSLGRTLPYLAGAIYAQEEVAMAATAALDVRPGESVFDMCAAPGGKSAQIARAAGPTGRVFASEIMNARMAALGATTSRLALTNVAGILSECRHVPFPYGSLDRVLCDVPCSGEGTARKVAGGWTEYDPSFVARLPSIQAQILRRALHLVKPGGHVVYSTCTFRPEENEAVLQAALGDLGEVVPFAIPGFEGSAPLAAWNGLAFRSDIGHARRWWPHTHDTGGFFVALIRRSDEPTRRRAGTVPPRPVKWAHAEEFQGKLAATLDWFGVPGDILGNRVLWARGNDKIWLADASLSPLPGIAPEFLGYVAFKASERRLWPTGALMQALGNSVTRQWVELDAEPAFRYAAGEAVELPSSARREARDGPVQVRADGFVLGKGILEGTRLNSQVAKGLRFA